MPSEHRIALQLEVGHHVGEGVGLVLAAPAHLFLALLQQFQHSRVGSELGIDGQRLYRHAHRMGKPLIGAAVIDRREQRFLLVVEFGKQIGIGRGKQRTLENSRLLAESIDTRHVQRQRACHVILAVLWLFQVGKELGEGVAAVEVLGIPLTALDQRIGLTQLRVGLGNLHEGQFLGSDSLAAVGFVNVLQHDLHRRSVHDDVMVIQKQVILVLIV